MSIVKESDKLRKALKERWDKLELKQKDVVKDAMERNFKIPGEALSRYMSGKQKGSLSEGQIIWLAYRYGIFVMLQVGIPKQKADGTVSFAVPPFNEERSLALLKKIFPNG